MKGASLKLRAVAESELYERERERGSFLLFPRRASEAATAAMAAHCLVLGPLLWFSFLIPLSIEV